jgi:hypothetical protein
MKKQFCARLNTDWAADILASLKGHGFSRAADE